MRLSASSHGTAWAASHAADKQDRRQFASDRSATRSQSQPRTVGSATAAAAARTWICADAVGCCSENNIVNRSEYLAKARGSPFWGNFKSRDCGPPAQSGLSMSDHSSSVARACQASWKAPN